MAKFTMLAYLVIILALNIAANPIPEIPVHAEPNSGITPEEKQEGRFLMGLLMDAALSQVGSSVGSALLSGAQYAAGKAKEVIDAGAGMAFEHAKSSLLSGAQFAGGKILEAKGAIDTKAGEVLDQAKTAAAEAVLNQALGTTSE